MKKDIQFFLYEERGVLSGGFLDSFSFAETNLHIHKVYIKYLANYESANQALNALNTKPNFVNFTEDLFETVKQQNPNIGFLHLASWLMTPVQRVPRYVLLLKNIVKVTENTHKDFEDLQRASDHMDQVTQFFNAGLDAKPSKKDDRLNPKRASYTLNRSFKPPPTLADSLELKGVGSPKAKPKSKLSDAFTAPPIPIDRPDSAEPPIPKTRPPEKKPPPRRVTNDDSSTEIPNYMRHTISSSLKVKESIKKPPEKTPLSSYKAIGYPSSSISAPTSPRRPRKGSNSMPPVIKEANSTE